MAKLSTVKIRQAKNWLASGWSHIAICEALQVASATVDRINAGYYDGDGGLTKLIYYRRCPGCGGQVHGTCRLCELRQNQIRRAMPTVMADKLTAERLELTVSELAIPERVANKLYDNGIITVYDLLQRTALELLNIRSIGRKSVEMIYTALENIGFGRRQSVL